MFHSSLKRSLSVKGEITASITETRMGIANSFRHTLSLLNMNSTISKTSERTTEE